MRFSNRLLVQAHSPRRSRKSPVLVLACLLACLAALTLFGCEEAGLHSLTPPLAPPEISAVPGTGANKVVVSWTPNPGAIGYNLYWNIIGRVSKGDAVFTNVTSPFTHKGIPGQRPYFYCVAAVSETGESALSPETWAIPRGSPFGSAEGGQGGGCGGEEGGAGGEEEGPGNNLSVPLLFAEGIGLGGLPIEGSSPAWYDHGSGLRPTELETDASMYFPLWDEASAIVRGDLVYYPQKTASTWQADWVTGTGMAQHVVVDWGDSLGSRPAFPGNIPVRIEVALFQRHGEDSSVGYSEPMNAYSMALLSGSGSTELQGTRATTYVSDRRYVFSVGARLRLEKLFGPGGELDPTVPSTTLSLAEGLGAEGPGHLKGEVTVSGRFVYGTVWNLKKTELTAEQKQGWWRLTFSLAPTVETSTTTLSCQTFMDVLDPSDEGHAFLDSPLNTTWTEIEIVEGTGGGGGCGGGGGGEEDDGGCEDSH